MQSLRYVVSLRREHNQHYQWHVLSAAVYVYRRARRAMEGGGERGGESICTCIYIYKEGKRGCPIIR